MKEQRISEHLQDSLILLTITDSEFAKIVVNSVPIEFFESKVTSDTYSILVQYIRKYGKAPKSHFQDELLKLTGNISDDDKEILTRYLIHLQEMRKPNKEYVMSRLNDFIKSRTLINATYEFAELVEKGKFDKATQIMYQALKSGIEVENAGVEILLERKDLIERGELPERLFTLNIEPIDKICRIQKTDFIVIAGPYKGGKSWFGHYIGMVALRAGLQVLHVSHENSLRDTTIRYDMMFGGLLDEKEKDEVEIRDYDMKKNKFFKKIQVKGTVYDKDLVSQNRKKLASFGGKLTVKKYSMGICSPIQLESLIDYLENFKGFIPEVVITDYADIMSPIDSSKQTRDSINETYIYLKRIADDRNLTMVTMSQINDEGLRCLINKGKLDGRHLAEDKRKFANIDRGLFIGTTEELEENDEKVVGCFANRNGIQGKRCIIGTNLRIGQIKTYWRPFTYKEG